MYCKFSRLKKILRVALAPKLPVLTKCELVWVGGSRGKGGCQASQVSAPRGCICGPGISCLPLITFFGGTSILMRIRVQLATCVFALRASVHSWCNQPHTQAPHHQLGVWLQRVAPLVEYGGITCGVL